MIDNRTNGFIVKSKGNVRPRGSGRLIVRRQATISFNLNATMTYLLWVIGSLVAVWVCCRIVWAFRWLCSNEKEIADIHRDVCGERPPRGPRMTKSAYEDLGELDDEGDA